MASHGSVALSLRAHNEVAEQMTAVSGHASPTHPPHKSSQLCRGGARLVNGQPPCKVLDPVQNSIETLGLLSQGTDTNSLLGTKQADGRSGHGILGAGKLSAAETGNKDMVPSCSPVGAANAYPPQQSQGTVHLPASPGSCSAPWSELHAHILAQTASVLTSVKGVIVLSGVCRSWRAGLTSDTQLLRRLRFGLDLQRPLLAVCPTHGVIEKSLRRRHCDSFPAILHKVGRGRGRGGVTEQGVLTIVLGMERECSHCL